jgi:choline kinase
MKIVILAAGKGSRLGGEGPKPLTQLNNGKSLLELQLEAIARYSDLEHVLVVVGYQAERIIEAFPNLHFIHNPLYAQENTAKSLLRALKGVQEDVLWMNGDVVFYPDVLQDVISSKRSCMAVNVGPVGDEEVKYRTNKEGRILEVSKEVKTPEGEAIGINYFHKNDISALIKNLAKCNAHDYFEKAIEFSIGEGVNVWAAPIDSGLSVEIDFVEDLARANQILKRWEKIS